MSKADKQEVLLRKELVGTNLKKWRESVKLSQGEVARKLHYSSPQFVSNWERGIALPPMDVLPCLMDIYQIDADTLGRVIYQYQEQLLALQKSQLEKLLETPPRSRG